MKKNYATSITLNEADYKRFEHCGKRVIDIFRIGLDTVEKNKHKEEERKKEKEKFPPHTPPLKEKEIKKEEETIRVVNTTHKTKKAVLLGGKKKLPPEERKALVSVVLKYADEAGVPKAARAGTFIPRNMRTAKILYYKLANKDVSAVYDAIEFTKADCEERKLSWTLETVEKRWGIFEKERAVIAFKKKHLTKAEKRYEHERDIEPV